VTFLLAFVFVFLDIAYGSPAIPEIGFAEKVVSLNAFEGVDVLDIFRSELCTCRYYPIFFVLDPL